MIKRTKIRSNGITFLYEQELSAGSVTAALFFKAGILWEKPREYGITRFVAQLLLREISAAAPEDFSFSLRCGRDHMAFLCAAPKECAEKAVSSLARMFDAPLFEPASVETLRRETLREIAAYAPTQADEDERLYFDRDNYAVPLFGTEKSVSALTADQLARWRALWFVRSNACFVLTGGFSDGQGKAIEALLRELPPQKHKNLNVKPLFPADQFFRTSGSDRFLPAQEIFATVTLLFEIDLGETKPVYAELLRRALTDPKTGALTRNKLTDTVTGTLRFYGGFAVLALSYPVFHSFVADSVLLLGETIAGCKDSATEATVAPFCGDYAVNRLYRNESGAGRAYELGLHNFILFTDDIVLPEQCQTAAVTERFWDAADRVLQSDNAMFIVRCNEKSGAALADIRRSVTAARIRLFV